MSLDLEDLRSALDQRAATIAVPEAVGVAELRGAARASRLRAATAVASAVLLVAGLAVVLRQPSPAPTSDVTADGGGVVLPAGEAEPATEGSAAPAGGGDGAGAVPVPTTAPDPSPATTIARALVPTTTPPTTEPVSDGARPTAESFALAAPGNWRFRQDGVDHNRTVLGGHGGMAEYTVLLHPAEGRTQRAEGYTNGTVRDAVHTKTDAVGLREWTLWGEFDTARTFRFAEGAAFEVPSVEDRRAGKELRFGGTSTDGATRIEVVAKAQRDQVLKVVDSPSEGRDVSVWTVQVDAVITATGDRSLTTKRTIWWAVDYGFAAFMTEHITGTSSSGEAIDIEVSYRMADTKPEPKSLNRQVTDGAAGE